MLPEELVQRVILSAGLDPAVARRLLEDVVAFYGEPVEAFVRRRHRELAARGERNEEIYAQIRAEVGTRLFKGPDCSTRQIRRIIYG